VGKENKWRVLCVEWTATYTATSNFPKVGKEIEKIALKIERRKRERDE
jgi:hypothetical protein